jgi:hypothetical protein
MSNQVCETCTNPSICKNCQQDRVVVTTPITRAFDSKNADGTIRHIIVGYGVLLNELDDFGTALSPELVEESIPLLMKYPALRFMHHTPFGHLVFNETIEGYSTHLDETGFFVVAEIGANFEKEFSLIKSGGWGFSWGMFPTAPPVQKRVGGKMGQVFEKGRVYEISVVDVPAQSNASITVIRAAPQPTQHESGFLNMLEASRGISTISTREPAPLTRAIDESQFPTLCNPEECPPDYARHCRANRAENYGKPCIYRTPTNEQLKHSETQQRSAKTIDNIFPNKPNFFKPKNLNECDEE